MTTTLDPPSTDLPSFAVGGIVTDSPRAKVKSRRIWAVAVVVVVGVGGAAATWMVGAWREAAREMAEVDQFPVTSRTFNVVLKEKGELRAAKSTDIKCEVEGRSTIISLIEEGTAVKEGDLLVELASDEIEERIRQEELNETNAITAYESAKTELDIQRDKNASDIRKGKLEIELKRLELEKYLKGEWVQTVKDAEIAIEQAEMTLRREGEDFEAAHELYEREFITKTEYDQDEFNFKRAQWDLVKANLAKTVLEKYTHVAESRRRESDVEEAEKECARVKKNAVAVETTKVRNVEGREKELALIQDQLAKLRTQMEKCRITAPTPGFVVYYSEPWRWGSDEQIKEGTTVHERQVLMQLPDTSQMTVILRIHEAKTDKLSVGQSATIEIEGMPGWQFTGKVTKIAVVADTQNRWLNPDLREYETEIMLDPNDAPLKPGVTAHAEILVETLMDTLAVPVQAIYSKTGRRYVFRSSGGKVEYVEVRVGAVSTEWAEIKDGVAEGENVLLAFSEEQTRMIPDLAPPVPRNGVSPAGPGAAEATQKAGQPGQERRVGKGRVQASKGVRRSASTKAP